jgi:hypothetical protein
MAPIWATLVDQTQLPCALYHAWQAPVQPVTMNMHHAMNSWYDLVGLSERDAEQCDGIDDSKASEPRHSDSSLAFCSTIFLQPLQPHLSLWSPIGFLSSFFIFFLFVQYCKQRWSLS